MSTSQTKRLEVGPQPGPQTRFLETAADIAIFGGAAGASKSWALSYEPLRHVKNPEFAGVIFRRTTPEIKKSGGMLEQCRKLYRPLGARFTTSPSIEGYFPSGARVSLCHLQLEDSVEDHKGAAYAYIGFDELTSFSKAQFFYMLSRNRSTCGVRPYIRASTNPDADSWVAQFIAWWIDPETGFPISKRWWDRVSPKWKGVERSGVLRYFIRRGDDIIWADSARELIDKYGRPDLADDDPEQEHPKSVTFIPGSIHDNKILLSKDPGYLSNLKALDAVNRGRLLDGNWKIRASAGLLFKRSWCKLIDIAPADIEWVRYWDLAATEKTESNDPDWTVGVKLGRKRVNVMGVDDQGKPLPAKFQYYIGHAERCQESPLGVRRTMRNIASGDGNDVRIGYPQDPAQAGKDQAQDIARELNGYDARSRIESGDKVKRFGPFSAQCEAGNVFIVKGPGGAVPVWYEPFVGSLEAFSDDAKHKDDADACSGAFQMFQAEETGFLDYMRQMVEAQKLKR